MIMPKYTPINEYLDAQPLKNSEITLSFSRVERMLGSPLPESALHDRDWWANEYSPTDHVQARAWLASGWIVDEVDLDSQWVRFVRS